jgi:hypothetical protein
LRDVSFPFNLAFHDLRPAWYRLDDFQNRVTNILKYRLERSFLGLAIGHDNEEQAAISLESNPTIWITWLWTLLGRMQLGRQINWECV